jgi:hypothetical protein
MCGCGRATSLAVQTDSRYGFVKGEPRKYISGHHKYPYSVEYIVDTNTECWNWQRCRDSRTGYASLNIDGAVQKAHRVYYERSKGKIPDGAEIHHKCENSGCVNPDHMEPLTRAEHNSRHGRGSLSQKIADDIRSLYAKGGVLQRELASMYGVKREAISKIINNKRWRSNL